MINKLSMWDREKILDKIALCILEKGQKIKQEKIINFPLVDILKEFYKEAEITVDFYSMENLELLYNEYNKEYENVGVSIEQLQQEGWILVMYNRWSSALHNLWIWENSNIGKEYKDETIIRFLIWLGKKSRHIHTLKITNPEDKLDKWRLLYHELPEVEWFVSNHYLIMEDNNYYVYRGYMYCDEIDKALARIWLEWKKNRPEDWMRLARALKGTYYIFEYLDYDEGENLFRYIQNEFFYKMDIPNWERTNKYYEKKRLFESINYLKETDKYKNIELWSGNRVLDQKNYTQYGFEYYRNEYIHDSDSMLILYPMLFHMEWGGDCHNKNFCDQLEKYDEICQFYMFDHYNSFLLYEMFITKGTFYMAFRKLIRYKRTSVLNEEIFDNTVIEIVKKILEEGGKRKDFLDGRQIGMSLFDLMILEKNKTEKSLLIKIVDTVGLKTWFELIWEDMKSYFQDLLKIENSVDWVNAYHMILICINRWFYTNSDNQELYYFSDFLEVVWEGYKIVFNKGEYIKFFEISYLKPEICNNLYENFIQKYSSATKKKVLLARTDLDEVDNAIPYYHYKKLLEFLYNILDMQREKDEIVKSVFIEVLENVLLTDCIEESKKDRAYFDYVYMQIYSAENIITKCINTLSSDNNSDNYILEHLLERDIPDLLVYFDATTDEKFKVKLENKINEKATIDALDIYSDERAIDIVLDNEIESLYPAVEKIIENKLVIWKQRNIPPNSDFIRYALHQKWRLKYICGKYEAILYGDNKFFQAMVYTEIEEYRNFDKADKAWRSIIESKDNGGQFATVYLNYLYFLNRELTSCEDGDKEHIQYVNKKFEWICRVIEDTKIQYWRQKEREDFVWFVIQQKKHMGEDCFSIFYSYKSKYELTTSIDKFIEINQSEVLSPKTSVPLNNNGQELSDSIRTFWAQSVDKKAISYYFAKGITGLNMPGKTLLVDVVLKTCDVLYNYGPQLIHIIKKDGNGLKNDKSKQKNDLAHKNVQFKLYEDNVTILFREVFNHAFGNSIKISVHDQQKMGTTGREYGGVFSPAEIDLVFYYDGGQHEIVESFVLNDNEGSDIFKDHMGKIIGNNTRHEKLSFMLVLENLYKSSSSLERYINYIENEAGKYLANQGIERMDMLPFEEAPYYIKEFEDTYPCLKVKRQKIVFKGGREQEILHIIIDMAKSQEGNIRKSTK